MPWIIALHLFGIIVWLGAILIVAGLLGMVPEEVGGAKERFIVAARSLFFSSANLGAGVMIATGVLLVMLHPEALRHGWFHLKLLLVLGLVIVHARLHRRMIALESEPASATRGEFVWIQAIASVLLLTILVLVLIRPF